MRGCALSNNTFMRVSADFVPYILFQFRGGSDVFGTVAYLPHALANNPGGTVNWYGVKSEDSCGRTGYPGYTGTSSSIGKGNMIRVTGRTYLKIDGGFVKTLERDTIDRAMTETINRIGHIMGIKTVAEFAENEAIIQELKTMGVDYAQGFGVCLPTPLFPLAPQARPEVRELAEAF